MKETKRRIWVSMLWSTVVVLMYINDSRRKFEQSDESISVLSVFIILSIAGVVGHFLINRSLRRDWDFLMNSFSENFEFTSYWTLELEIMIENPTRIIGLLIVLGAVVAAIIFGGGQEKFLDMPSLLLVAIIGVGNVIGAKGDNSILTKFGDGCVRAVSYTHLTLPTICSV